MGENAVFPSSFPRNTIPDYSILALNSDGLCCVPVYCVAVGWPARCEVATLAARSVPGAA